MNFLNYVLTMDIVDININYTYQAADPTPDTTFSLTVQEEYGITCQLTILTFLIQIALNDLLLPHSWLVIAKFIFSSRPIVVLCYQ